MGLTQVSTDGVKDNTVTAGKMTVNSVGNSEMKDDAIDTAELVDASIDIVHLSATGTAGNTTYLRGDNTWTVPPDTNTTYSVGDGGLTQNNFTDADHTKLDGIAAGAEVNVQADWNATSGDAEILNKPTVPTVTGSTNNTITTVTGANAIQGEANLTFSGSNLKVTNSSGAAEVTVVTPDNTDGGIYFNDGANAGAVTYLHTDNSMSFRVNTADTFKLDSSGNARIADGDLIIGTSGHGIDFSATGGPTNGSDTSELLADYEAGNWTPASSNGMLSGATYYYQQGRYVKIGRHVTFNFYIYWNSAKTDNQNIAIGGLPYASSNESGTWTPGSGSITYHSMTLNNSTKQAGVYFNKNVTYFSLYDGGTSFSGAYDQSQNATYLIGGGTYMTD